jgi:hypothetical protein
LVLSVAITSGGLQSPKCQTGAVKLASGLKDDYRQICAKR